MPARATPRKQVETDLTRRFEQFKVKEATLGKLRQVLAARERGLVAGREKLKAMQAAKGQLEVDVANLDARLEMVKVAQSTSEFNFDDSRLSRTKDLVSGHQRPDRRGREAGQCRDGLSRRDRPGRAPKPPTSPSR